MKFELNLARKFSKLNFSFGLPILNKTFSFNFRFYDSPLIWTNGIGSRCMDGQYVGFGDFDDINLDSLKAELKDLQNLFDLGPVHIFRTGETNFHFICLDKKSLRDWFEILNNSSADTAFINSPKFFKGREWVLRIAEKGNRPAPVYVESLPGVVINPISSAHKKFIVAYYGVPANLCVGQEDGLSELPCLAYSTANRVK